MHLARLLPLLALLLPSAAHAQVNPCPLGAIIPCGVGGAAGLQLFIGTEIIPEFKLAFAGVMLIFFVYYAIRLILESGEESTTSEIKNAYGQAMTGAVFVSVAGLFVAGVGNDASQTLINSDVGGPIYTIFETIIIYGKYLMGTLVIIFIAFQGVRLVLLHGQESEVEKQKERFFHGLVGVAVVLLASAMVNAVTGSNAGILGAEGKAAANLGLEIFGFLVVMSFIVSGAMLVFSVNEDLKDRAKKAMFGSVIGMIVVFAAYMIVTYVLSV
jgi:Type IV secretion system pilin